MEGTGYLDEQLNLRHERFHRIGTRRRTVVGLRRLRGLAEHHQAVACAAAGLARPCGAPCG